MLHVSNSDSGPIMDQGDVSHLAEGPITFEPFPQTRPSQYRLCLLHLRVFLCDLILCSDCCSAHSGNRSRL